MMRWGGMTETELQRQRRGGEWKAFYYVSKSLYPSNCFWRGFEADVDRQKKQNVWAFIIAWPGVFLPSDYQMYPCSLLCLNDIDSTDRRASLTFIGFVISECLFQVCQKDTTNKQDIQVVFWGRHINDDAAFHVRTVTQKLTSGCAEPSDGTTKCPYVKDQGRLSQCSLWASPAPNSCYTLWCSIEMWAALLIARLLASSLMAHCSFHDLSSPKRCGGVT